MKITFEKDPVCGMTVSSSSPLKHIHDGTVFYFCNPSCLEKFRKQPAKYLNQEEFEAMSPPADSAQIEYTCPMDPEIVQMGPGICPICGMALEPKTVTVEEPENVELEDMKRRFGVAAAMTIPILFLAMGEHFTGFHLEAFMPLQAAIWLQLAASVPVVIWCGWPLLERGWKSFVNRHLSMFSLIALGVVVAFVYSILALIAPGLFPDAFRTVHGQVGVYFEAAAVIVTLVLLGQVLELRARSKTGAAIPALSGLSPKTARIIRKNETFVKISMGAMVFIPRNIKIDKTKRKTRERAKEDGPAFGKNEEKIIFKKPPAKIP